ncbi:hypothetical protein IPM09_00655 [Candidatus Saccharibacteria bacterium]|nr:MAG: hypothetical protein IPM09_00655 [Candidatus Saccharibacteria bacterium]
MGNTKPKRYRLTIVSTRRVAGVPVTRVLTQDQYYHGRRYRLERTLVRTFTNFLQWYLERHPGMPFTARGNLARHLVYMPAGMRAWRAYMPGGFATYHVHDPRRAHMQNGKKLDAITRAFFRHTYDAVNLRSRAYIMDWLASTPLMAAHGSRCRWVSLAGGSGQPVFDVFNELPKHIRDSSSLIITDSDSEVLRFAKMVYEKHNLPIHHVGYEQLDVLETSVLSTFFKRHHPDIIDAMGLFEYLSDEQSVRLLNDVYQSLPKGGVFIFSNMWSKRPHLDVHQRALGWPGVIQRTIHEVVALLAKADVPLEAQSVYHDDDNVYCVYRVVKQ